MKLSLADPVYSGLLYDHQRYNTLMAQNIRIFEAKGEPATDHFGVGRANWYERLVRAGMYERKQLYGFTARVICSPGWQKQACQARARYKAIKECL